MLCSSLPSGPSRICGLLACILFTGMAGQAADGPRQDRPNVVVILADDLGFGDVHCYDPDHAKVPTPNIDRIAAQGMRFTDAHASASLCSPTRYALLTGRFSWRTHLQTHVVRMYGTPLIAPDRLTLPGMLHEQGYRTACFGKWHLGWDWPLRQKDGSVARAPANRFLQQRSGVPVFSEAIGQGPTTRGFDRYFGVDVPNYPPYTFIKNDRMTADPAAEKTVDDRIRWGKEGPMVPGWQFDRILPTIIEHTEDSIAQWGRDGQPFFLYLALTTPHEPIAPSEPFRGKSGLCDVADLIMETDAAVGRVADALQKAGCADNTLLIVTSDNGHCHYTGVEPFEKAGHRVAGPYKGYKNNLTEGGHRVPFVVRWPGIVAPGTVNDQLVCLSDIFATCAEICGTTLTDDSAEDSVSFLPLLRGSDRPTRDDLVLQGHGTELAIRSGPWKLIAPTVRTPPADGSHAAAAQKAAAERKAETFKLFNVVDDPKENRTFESARPDIVARLHGLLTKYIADGRSTPGPARHNDISIRLPAIDSGPIPSDSGPQSP